MEHEEEEEEGGGLTMWGLTGCGHVVVSVALLCSWHGVAEL